MNKRTKIFREKSSCEADHVTRTAELSKAIDKYGEHLIGFFTRTLGDPHLAEEVASDLWVHVWETFGVKRFRSHGLIMYAARQFLIRELRRKKARSKMSMVEFNEEEYSDEPRHFGTEEEEKATKEMFWEMFSGVSLTEEQKEMFWLRIIHDYTLEELAQKYGVSKSTIHERIAKLERDCRDYLYKVDGRRFL